MKNIKKKIVLLCFLSVICFSFTIGDFSQSVIEIVEKNISEQKNQNLSRVIWMEIFTRFSKSSTLPLHIKEVSRAVASYLFSGIISIKGPYDNSFREVFLEQYGSGITTPNVLLPSRCFDNYLFLDLVAWAVNIPTALIIATWKMEADCKYGPYKNGPFQLMSYTYPTERIDYMLFIHQLIDFVLFTKHKWTSYVRANLKQGLQVQMNYTYWTFDAIVKHGALYNGLSGKIIIGDIQPLQKEYVWGNFGIQNTGAVKDGLIVNFLKVLYWEKENREKVYEQAREFFNLQ